VTRGGPEMTDFIKSLGQSLDKNGNPEVTKSGAPRMVGAKYGASTTWMGKLLYRLNAGRNGACPVLVFGITPACVRDRLLRPGRKRWNNLRTDFPDRKV